MTSQQSHAATRMKGECAWLADNASRKRSLYSVSNAATTIVAGENSRVAQILLHEDLNCTAQKKGRAREKLTIFFLHEYYLKLTLEIQK